MRWRITLRNDSPRREMRGYFDGTPGELEQFAERMNGLAVVIASPADRDYDPFRPETNR